MGYFLKDSKLCRSFCYLHQQTEQRRLFNVCKRQANLSDHRLISQQQVAGRLLRQLVFEVIEEYGKSHIWLSRREEYM